MIPNSKTDHKAKISQPHFIFSAENPKYPDKNKHGFTHEQALKHLKNLNYDAHPVNGHYGAPEKSIIVYGTNPKQNEGLHRFASDLGQDSSIHSNGQQHEMRFHHGADAGKTVHGEGTEFHSNKPSDFYTTLPNGNHFTHNFKFDKSEKMPKLTDAAAEYKKHAESGMGLMLPVSVNGKKNRPDIDLPYHASIKVFDSAKDSPLQAHEKASSLDIKHPDPKEVGIEPTTLKGRTGHTMHVLRLHGPHADAIKAHHDQFKEHGHPENFDFHPHITVDKPTWDKVVASKAKTAHEAGIEFHPAELHHKKNVLATYKKSEELFQKSEHGGSILHKRHFRTLLAKADESAPPTIKPKHSEKIRQVADQYASTKGIKLDHNIAPAKVDPAHASKIAQAYHEMPHNPHDPHVKQAYGALINETKDQYNHILNNTGLTVSKIKPGMDNPYKNGSKDLFHDVHNNNHMWYYPTESGFGSTDNKADHPMLGHTDVKDKEGNAMPANDLFRVVHDYFGHAKEGNGFGANGEEGAWNHHKQMYSPEAQRALTSETRGQNSWVNFGPHGEHNKKNPHDTIYADQKAGLLPSQFEKSEPLEKGVKTAAAALGLAGSLMASPLKHAVHSNVTANPAPKAVAAAPKQSSYSHQEMLRTIASVESNNGKFENHKPLGGINAGDSAYGKYALTPNTIRETIGLNHDLKSKHGKALRLQGPELARYMSDNKGLEDTIADKHLARLEHHFGQNPSDLGYAWLQGIRGTYKAKKENKDINSHWHVKKINGAYGKQGA